MNRKLIVRFFVLATALFLFCPLTSTATTFEPVAIWQPLSTNSTVITIDTNFITSSASLYVHNIDLSLNLYAKILDDQLDISSSHFSLVQEDNIWRVESELGGSITLGAKPEFGFCLKINDSSDYIYNYSYTPIPNTDLYNLTESTSNMDVMLFGAKPVTTPGSTVPLPASAWIFGSGLLGLVGIRRKFVR